SGTISTDGTLLYWLGQHDYRRGEQPWFYYLLLFPQYEFIAALFGTIATAIVGVRLLLVGIGRLVPGPRFFFQTFLAAWFCGIFLALSWAGEKMPWLVIHITLPATLLAAALLGELWERWRPIMSRDSEIARAPGWRTPQWALLGSLVALAACWFLIAAQLTYGEFVTAANPGGWERALTSSDLAHWWLLAVPPLLAIAAILLVAIWRGARAAAQPALAALVLLLALAQIHAAWRLVYQEGDVPKDMLVYTQTSPDMKRTVDELTQLSELTTGGHDMEIWYDDNLGVSWPMQWYLRDFPNRHLYGGALTGPPNGAPVVLVADHNLASVEPYLEGYTAQEYALRWWFPESIYRDFAIAPEIPVGRSALNSDEQPHGLTAIVASVVDSLANVLTPQGQQSLYRIVMYRDLPLPIGLNTGSYVGYYGYKVYIRNDLLPLLDQIRY
ncbi:MAG: TIGR03663 family protein, partial [Thermomicrobiales bacterium]|nr:TIGR03663 family protein [Thermomicrobiales bacterium]